MSVRNTMQHDVWTAGDAYEPFVGRWSRRAAREFIEWLALAANSRWLDVGCGTGALTQTILTTATPREVLGVDPSEGFIAYACRHTQDSRAKFQVGDARALPVANSEFDVAVAGLVLNFVPDPARAAAEMHRAVRVGGTVAAYVWDYADGMQLLRRFWDAAVTLDPAARELDEGRRFPLCRPEALCSLLNDVGLEQTEVWAIDVLTVFRNFDDYWSPFLGRQGPAPGSCMSLPDDRRARLRNHLQTTLPVAPDGTIRLTARAFAVRGVKPA
ncbi:MAG: class I SAM-dependent methyltransferase [Xanthobacteraceae bacterium]